MRPTALVFDVNETLLDIDSLAPLFQQIFGEPAALREWFGQLVTYSMTSALSRRYVDFFSLGEATLRMLADIHRVSVTGDEVQHLSTALLTMPAHPDVADGLSGLRAAGYRLAALTNSPPNLHGPSPLEHAGLGDYFERQFSVDACRTFKPDPAVYQYVCGELDVAPEQTMMVAAHVWDTVGAQCAGLSAALITRPGNAPLPVADLPQPTLVVADVRQLVSELHRIED